MTPTPKLIVFDFDGCLYPLEVQRLLDISSMVIQRIRFAQSLHISARMKPFLYPTHTSI